jgi:hypothetical protein
LQENKRHRFDFMLPALTKRIKNEWNRLYPGIQEPSSIEYMGIGGAVEGGTTTYLGFTDKTGNPRFAVKIHRFPDAEQKAVNEAQVLSFLHSLDSPVRSSLPRILLCEKISGHWVLVQSIITGLPLHAELTDNGLPEIQNTGMNLNTVLEWVLSFHADTIQNDISSCENLRKDQNEKIKQFLSVFDLSYREKELLIHLSNHLDQVMKCGSVISHGDFCRHNILKENSGKKIGVIDWTDSKLVGLPFYDYYFFITTYFLQIRKYQGLKGFIHAFTSTFFEKNRFSEMIFRCLKAYCQKTSINHDSAERLFVLFIINHALFEYDKIQRCLRYGELPRFSVYLSSEQNLDFDEASRAQIWIHFFHSYCNEKENFIFNIYS